jgi:hypothetical protein
VAFGLAMGVVAALFHLGLTWIRASVSLRGRVALAMLTLPLAVAIPAICLFAAFWFAPTSGWMAVLAHALLRSFTMARAVRS